MTMTSLATLGSDHGDATFNEALQIDMKGLVGDAVGNVSARSVYVYLRSFSWYSIDEHQPDEP
jgi:hypothetical protein